MPERRNEKVVRFGLSRRKHLPCIWVAGTTNFRPYRLDVFLKFRGFTWIRIDNEHVAVGKNDVEFVLLRKYAALMANEYVDWGRDYKLPFSLKDKTVLDVGAGCGETIFYFATKGCRNFIAVEPDKECANLLKKNAIQNSLNVKIYNDVFRKAQLNEEFDFIKCDCEGGEAILLDQEIAQPIALEVHGVELFERFIERHFRTIRKKKNSKEFLCTMRNY
jgi:hypothetical protein